jgi:D-alanyl-D-alanine carboxypeptidase (penicillin-binding protein 5/6)
MTSGPFLDTTARRRRRAAQRRRRARRRLVAVLLAVTALLGVGVFAGNTDDERSGAAVGAAAPDPSLPGDEATAAAGQTALGPLPLAVDLDDPSDRVRLRFKRPPRAGLLVNLDTGEVLWRRNAERTLPIASLTKMMTGLVAADALKPDDKVRITKSVLAYRGSGVGVLPRGKRVKVETLLHGLMLPSGNDAARALAFRTSGSIAGFVRRMNGRAAELGLRCTRFASVEGLSAGNRSCPADLAALARKVLDTPRLARIVRKRKVILPFPIKGGRVEMYNNNPLLRRGYPGIIGVKTGFTNAAGRCLVAAARRGGTRLAAIVLDSPDPGTQARQLLDRGFSAIR